MTKSIGATKVIHGTTDIIDAEVAFFSNVKKKADTCMNYTRPPLAIGLEPIKNSFLDAKNRGVHLRYLTEITKENLSYCKQLAKIVHEIRHLDEIKGNYMVSESEYIAPLILFEYGKIAPQAIYSNISQIVEQQQYVFETLWTKAISFEDRVKETEGVRAVHYETKVLANSQEIADRITTFLENSNELFSCTGYGGLELGYRRFSDVGKHILARYRKGKHKGIKLLAASINKNTADSVKVILDQGIQVRETKNMPPMNFTVSDKEVHATIDKMEGKEMAQSVLVSDEPVYVNHFRYIFEELWKNAVDAKTRIESIEKGIDFGDIEVIPNASRAAKLYLDLVRNAQEEIMIMFPTPNAFLRQYKIGAVQLAKKSAQQRNVKVRILMPKYESTEQPVQILTNEEEEKQEQGKEHSFSDIFSDDVRGNIEVRNIEQVLLDTHATVLIVDRKYSLVMEIRDDSKMSFNGAIGLSTYSNSRASVLSYLSLLENLWLETELHEQIKESNTRLQLANEQLKVHDKMQRDFINIAAHELRTPIQPILGLSQILRTKTKDTLFTESLDIIIRNSARLQRLTEDILDIQKVESHTLHLNKEKLNLNELVSQLVAEYKKQIVEEQEKNSIKILTEIDMSNPVVVYADKNRLVQVIHNLIDNSVKFTKEGTIVITVKRKREGDQTQDQVVIMVKDTGKGIDHEILPRLFTKFVTKSHMGTGLGLYISKAIVEAHNGTIWAKNNDNGRGATFTFSLPINA